MSWINQTKSVLDKDLRGEFRQKSALTTIFLFSFVVIMAVSFSLGGISPGAKFGSVLFWITILFSDLAGFSHIFVKEEEMGTALALKLSGDPSSIFWGKYFFNLFLGITVTIFVIPMAIVFLNMLTTQWFAFWLFSLLGTIAIVSGTTLIAAITAKAQGKSSLFTILSFPVLLPVLIIVINGTEAVLLGNPLSALKNELLTLLSYIMLMLTVGHFLFEYVWKEG